jgi:hypothetical protein
VLLAGCSDSYPDGAASIAPGQQGKLRFAASSTTRTELGVDHWEISRQDESATIRAAVTTGYSAEGDTLRLIKLRRTAGENEGWSEFSVGGQPPVVVRFARHAGGTMSQEGPDGVHDNASARETVMRFGNDLQDTADSSSLSTSSLRVQTYPPLVGPPADLTPSVPEGLWFQCFQDCMRTLPGDLFEHGGVAYCRELGKMGVC